MDKKQIDDDFENDFTTDEFDETYLEEDDLLLEDDDVSEMAESSEMTDGSLDFVEDDIDTIYDDQAPNVVDGEDYAEDDLSNAYVPPVKAKPSMNKAALIAIVVGVVGVGLYFSGLFSGSTSSNENPSFNQEVISDSEGGDTEVSNTSDELGNLYEDNFSETDAYYEAEQTVAEEIVAPVGNVNNNLEEDLFEDQDSLADVNSNIEDIPVSVTESNLNTDANNTNLSEVNDQVAQDLQTFKADITARLDQIQSALNNNSGNQNNDVSSDLADIKNSINQLSGRMNEIEAKVKTISTSEVSKPARSEPSEGPKPLVPVTKAEKPSPAAAEKPAVKASTWEIRAIQVGKAVIAKKGGSETRNIVVGDSVPGLGTIKDITYKNGGWIIDGSSGSVKQ